MLPDIILYGMLITNRHQPREWIAAGFRISNNERDLK